MTKRMCPKCKEQPRNPWRITPGLCLGCLRDLNVAEGGVKTDEAGAILNPSVAPLRGAQR